MSLENLTDEQLKEYYNLYKDGISKSSRFEMIKINSYDVKFAYHILRLLDEAQQLLETGEMDLRRAKEAMKAIRRGEWSIEEVKDWAINKERELEIAFTNCSLPPKADEVRLKALLLQCLEEHYGSLEKCIELPDKYYNIISEIKEVFRKNGI